MYIFLEHSHIQIVHKTTSSNIYKWLEYHN